MKDLTYGMASVADSEKPYGLEMMLKEMMTCLEKEWGGKVPDGVIASMNEEAIPGWGVDPDGTIMRHARTDTLRHTTIETANKATTLRSDVQDDVMDMVKPLVQEALEGGRRVKFPPTGFSLEAAEQDRTMHGTIHHDGFGPIHITVSPPEHDGREAHLDVSITALLDGARSGAPPHDEIMAVMDLERCIAWAWLTLHGHAQ